MDGSHFRACIHFVRRKTWTCPTFNITSHRKLSFDTPLCTLKSAQWPFNILCSLHALNPYHMYLKVCLHRTERSPSQDVLGVFSPPLPLQLESQETFTHTQHSITKFYVVV